VVFKYQTVVWYLLNRSADETRMVLNVKHVDPIGASV
jgi:hypothetical protein